MKLMRIVCCAALACCSTLCFAQEAEERERRSHNLYLEFFESASMVSVSYDTRFPGSDVLGWRAGLGYAVLPINAPLGYEAGLSVPVGVNALFGRRASKFEVGVVVAPTITSYRDYYCSMRIDEDGDEVWFNEYFGKAHWHGACSLGFDLGYRLQRRSGFGLRVGISPSVSVSPGGVYFNLLSFYPHLGFAYTFR